MNRRSSGPVHEFLRSVKTATTIAPTEASAATPPTNASNRRPRPRRNRRSSVAHRQSGWRARKRSRWIGRPNPVLRCLVFATIPAGEPEAHAKFIDGVFDPGVSFDDLAMVRDAWDGILVLKGVQSVEDARTAADHGAATAHQRHRAFAARRGGAMPTGIRCAFPGGRGVRGRLAVNSAHQQRFAVQPRRSSGHRGARGSPRAHRRVPAQKERLLVEEQGHLDQQIRFMLGPSFVISEGLGLHARETGRRRRRL